MTYSLILGGASLCSKWGFNDGNSPEDLPDDLLTEVDWHHVLRTLVRSHLVPAIKAAGYSITVYDIDTAHNPIRADMINGIEIDHYDSGGAAQVALMEQLPDVTVSLVDIVAATEDHPGYTT